jgi:hypothetical protein
VARRRGAALGLIALISLVAGLALGAPGPGAGGGAPASTSTSTTTPRVVEIGWVGDTTPGSMYGQPPDQGRALFAGVRDQLQAPDLMIANLEGTFSVGGPSKCGDADSSTCYAFQAPPKNAAALTWAGIDLVSLANNHAHDYLEQGMTQTIDALEANRIAYTGLPNQVTVVDVKGARVAVVGFSPYSWNASILDIPAAQQLVRKAAAESDLVVVLMHAGAEGADKTHTPTGDEVAYGEDRGQTRDFAHAVVDAGADLVLGSGPHVVRGIERYHSRLIAYSLGNFAGWDNFSLAGRLALSGLLTVRIDTQGRLLGGRWLSLHLAEPGVPGVDPGNASAALVRQLSTEDFPATYAMDTRGVISAE